MGSFTLNTHNANVQAGIPKDPINAANVKNPEVKVNNFYKL
jgi:hypothetical protein